MSHWKHCALVVNKISGSSHDWLSRTSSGDRQDARKIRSTKFNLVFSCIHIIWGDKVDVQKLREPGSSYIANITGIAQWKASYWHKWWFLHPMNDIRACHSSNGTSLESEWYLIPGPHRGLSNDYLTKAFLNSPLVSTQSCPQNRESGWILLIK